MNILHAWKIMRKSFTFKTLCWECLSGRQVLVRPRIVRAQRLGGMQRPVGVAEHLPRQEYDISLARGDNLFSLRRLRNKADGSAGDSCLGSNPGRKGDLEAGTKRNRL